jgi:peptidyl-prolyl cis-trans isomerase SurA
MKRHALIVALVGLAATLTAQASAQILEQILVKVNGEIITKTDLEQRQIQAIRQKTPNFRPTSDAELQKALLDVTPEVIVGFVDELLLVQRGRELGYALGNEQFRNIIDNIKKENKIESEEQFQAALKQEGVTLDELRRQIERQMLVSRVQQDEVMGKISVTEDEVAKLYEESKGKFTTEPQLTLREVLVAVPASEKGVNVAQDDEAKAKAEEIKKRVDAGEPIAKLASELSDSPSKANGGLIGPISRTDLSEDLLKIIDPLKPGQTTPVIRTTRGYQFFRLESATARQVKTLEEARPQIAQEIAGRKQQGQMLTYLQQLRSQAIIDWKNEEVKKAYEAGLKQQATLAPTSGR